MLELKSLLPVTYQRKSTHIHLILINVISNLKKNNIVTSKEGKNGGAKLNLSPSKITLKQIFESTFEEISLGFSKNKPNPKWN